MEPSQDPNSAIDTLVGGKYLLKRMLGQGGMGAVYEAENTFLRAPVAIKVVRPEVARRDDVLRRFVQEAQAAAQVRHANIVSVLDFGYDDARDVLYIVQEFLEGTDLKRRLRAGGPMAPREAIELLLPVMRALTFAHSKGVVHRDLKPDNIFLCETPDGVVPKLIDFGIAKVLGDDGQSVQQTRTLMVMGTPLYMSPEQARGDRAVDHQTDIWQLGVVLYHMLSGRHPYEGTTHNLITAAIITREPTRIEAWLPNLAPDVAALVHGAVAWNPEQRFPTMDAFWQAARACSAMRPSATGFDVTSPPRSVTSTAPSLVSVAPPLDAGTHAPQVLPVATQQRSRGGAIGLLLAVAALAALATVAIATRVKGTPPSATHTVTATLPVAAPSQATAEPSAPASAPPIVAVQTIAALDASTPPARDNAARPVAPSVTSTSGASAARGSRALPSSRGATEPRPRRPSSAGSSVPLVVY